MCRVGNLCSKIAGSENFAGNSYLMCIVAIVGDSKCQGLKAVELGTQLLKQR